MARSRDQSGRRPGIAGHSITDHEARNHVYRIVKRTAVFLLGSYFVAAQVAFIREFLVVSLGNELCLGIIFSSWFLGIALGAALGARLARGTDAGEKPFFILTASLAFLSPCALLLIRLLRQLLSVRVGEYIPLASLLVATWILIIPFSFFIGLVFPFACLLSLGAGERCVRNVGRVYVIESLGSIAGGALFTFLLAGRVSTVHILTGWCAALWCVLFLLSCERGRHRLAGVFTGLCSALALGALISGVAGRIDALSIRARWRSINPRLPLIASVDSKYENITVAKREEQYDLFGSGQYYFSFPDPYGYAASTHVIMSEHPAPARVLLVGGGAGGMIAELIKYRLALLRYVELDPELIRVTERYLDPRDVALMRSPPVAVWYGDGRRFVKQTDERFDVIIVNVPDPSTAMLNRFYTREFYEEARRVMAPGGMLATRLSSPSDYYGEEVGSYAGSVYLTLKSVFPYVLVTPTEENYFFAAREPHVISSDAAVLRARWERRGIATDYFTPHHFLIWWLPERVAFTRASLERLGRGCINTDLKPMTYYFNLIIWARCSGARFANFLQRLARVPVTWYMGLLGALFVLRLIYVFYAKRGPRCAAFHALLAIAAMGLTAMSLEIVLIFAFQNIYGYVYQMMGMIVALFMAGLAAGGFISNEMLKNPLRRWPLWLGCLECLLALYAVLVPLFITHVGSAEGRTEYLFMALVVLTGFMTGAGFPIANQVYNQHSLDLGRSAGRVNCSDHLGACAGSILTGVIFIPLLGIGETCLILLVINGLCGILLIVNRP